MAKNELISLSILNIAPMHTYAINEIVKQVGLEHWAKISTASLYNSINKLEKAECVSVEVHQVGNMPPRKVFSLTKKGEEKLHSEMVLALTKVSSYDEEFYLSMVFGSGLETEEFISLLEARKQALENLYHNKNIEEEKKVHELEQIPHANILMQCGVDHYHADINMIDKMIELLTETPNYFEIMKNEFRRKIESEQGGNGEN